MYLVAALYCGTKRSKEELNSNSSREVLKAVSYAKLNNEKHNGAKRNHCRKI
jgi:SHS2 domain-containing protein